MKSVFCENGCFEAPQQTVGEALHVLIYQISQGTVFKATGRNKLYKHEDGFMGKKSV